MCGAAPVAGLNLKTLTNQLAAQRGIIEIAADDEPAGAACLNKAMDDILCAPRLPVGELRRADFGHADRANAAGAERGVKPAAFEIGGDDFGDLAAEAVGAQARNGCHRRGREWGDGDDGAVLRQRALDRFPGFGWHGRGRRGRLCQYWRSGQQQGEGQAGAEDHLTYLLMKSSV